VLSDGIVGLRPPAPADIDDITLGCQDPESIRWTTVPVPYEREHAVDWVAQHAPTEDWWANPTWAVTVMPRDRWSGSLDLRPDGEGGAAVGYLMAPWSRGQGHGARALRLACSWAFSVLDLEVITWHAYVGNDASLRTARRAGFRIADHVFRGYGAQRGERRDCWIGTLTPGDLAFAGRAVQGRMTYTGPKLTRRELMVLSQLALGQSNRVIAADLRISENTVKNHVRSILEKLQAKSRAEAVVIGLRHGLVTLP
jgi:RimJ/RimL family protein N-acetyltransferase/DNA-binding CsgD family transcriptional regulator